MSTIIVRSILQALFGDLGISAVFGEGALNSIMAWIGAQSDVIKFFVGVGGMAATWWWSKHEKEKIKIETKAKTETEMIKRSVDGRTLTLLALCLFPMFIGCTSYRHDRFGEDGKPIESTRLKAPFLTRQAITGLKTRVVDQRSKDQKYTRSVGVDATTNEGDVQSIDALGNLLEKVAKGAAAGAIKP